MPKASKQKASIFYSWQSDLPNGTNRGLIQRALEAAADSLEEQSGLGVTAAIDRDTLGLPGSPDIADAIFKKIEAASVVVCDVSIVTDGTVRPSPNPNVLVELGYALHALGSDRVVLAMNAAFGGPELLPFDLRQRRILTYRAEPRQPVARDCPKGTGGKAPPGV